MKDFKYAALYEPYRIRNLTIRNRFNMAPMGALGLSDSEGGWNQRGIDYYARRAKGEVGLIITGVTVSDTTVESQSMPNLPNSTHNPVHFVRTSLELTERVHAYGTKIFLMMGAGFGRVAMPTNLGEFDAIAPSAIPHRWTDDICRPITKEEIQTIIKGFGKGAYNAKRGGFDGIEVHAVHEGYLLDQFAISIFNQRDDEYGGSLENRLRFAKEIREEIARTCGWDFPVTMRYSLKSMMKDWKCGAMPGEEFKEMGRDWEEGLEAAKLLEKFGYDGLDVDAGCYDAWWWCHPPMYFEKGMYRQFCKPVKEVVSIPVICSGRMDDPDMALAAVQDGTCDLVSLGRPLLADPDYITKLRTGRRNQIRPCLSCHEGCMGRVQKYSAINCAVNPQTARERFTAFNPVVKKKKVCIIGGGPAGCEAARVLSERGHEAHLFEAKAFLGGNLIPGGAPSFKSDDRALAAWYTEELERLGADVHLNTKVSAADVLSGGYDAVIVATGGKPKVFSLGCPEKEYTAAQVLLKEKDPGEKAVIIGGGLVGCELSLHLAMQGKQVTVIEALPERMAVNGPVCTANHDMLTGMMDFKGVTTVCSARAESFDGAVFRYTVNGAAGENAEAGKTFEIPADSVILAAGYESCNELYHELCGEVDELYLLGDANRVSNIMYAIWDAYEIANHI